jgi:hypothetical protein
MNCRRLISDMGLSSCAIPVMIPANTAALSPVGRPLVRYFGSPIVHLLVKRAEYHATIVLD